jgi:hypothetical protein
LSYQPIPLRSTLGATARGVAALCALIGLAACSDDTSNEQPPIIIIEEPREDMAVEPDLVEPSDMDTTPDAAADMVEQFPVNDNPEGFVWLRDPTTDNRQATLVMLPKPNNTEGRLSNQAANVYNCINELGEPLAFMGFEVGNLCKEVQSALPGADGHYKQHIPPLNFSDPNDTFSEVQMYYHVHKIWSYLFNDLGVTSISEPIDALTNVQLYTNQLAAGFLGIPPGWFPFDNAAFVFPDAFAQIGLPPRDKGAIVFGQGQQVDFSYDSSVIYHEFGHSLIGPDRFSGVFPDRWGLNNTPGGINEGLADYFAASLTDDAVVGRYGLAAFGPALVRDLNVKRTCPEHLATEVHEDGKIIGSAMWNLRTRVGKTVTDQLALRVIASANMGAGFDQFATLLQTEADRVSAEVGAAASEVLAEHGLSGGCNSRAREWVTWRAGQVPIGVASPQQFSGGFSQGVPAYFQFFIQVPEGKAARLSWEFQASQGGPGGGGAQSQLQLATRKEQPVELDIRTTRVNILEDQRFTPPVSNRVQTITLEGDCLAAPNERTYLMFINAGAAASVNRMNIEIIDAGSDANAQTCAQDTGD